MLKLINQIKNFLKKHSSLRLFARKVVYHAERFKYRMTTKEVEVSQKTILFESFMGAQYSCNPRGIYEAIINDSRFENYELIWAFTKLEEKTIFSDLKRARLVEYKSAEYYQACASAKYIITNSNLDFAIVPKKEQVVIQTWHGTPLKRLRCDIETQNGNAINSLEEIMWKNDVDIVRYDYFLSPSQFCTEKFKSAFRIEKLNLIEMLIETGYPRNDFLINYSEENVNEIKQKIGINNINKKVILYAPTFRDNQHEVGLGYTYVPEIDFMKLQEALSEEYIILFRPHYFIANQFDFSKYNGFIYDVTKIDDIKELYIIADLLITDYSSVFFDYAILKRPVIFYMYDLKEYADEIRGFYLGLDELPGPIVKNEEELVGMIKSSRDHFDYETYDKFNCRFNSLDDGQASVRVLEDCILK